MAGCRNATPDDATSIAQMLHDFNVEYEEPSPGPSVLEPRIRGFIREGPKHFLLADDDVGVQGFAQFDFHVSVWSDGPILFLDELYVKPTHRGYGLGKMMMETMVSIARERGASGMEVVTGEDDTAARGLYESFGFENEIEGSDRTRSLFYELEF
ncbi:MAG: GNAT family N-acetyltransferase [Actinomycetota bacterium]|nr:GNAT family N-acetyltransferase [Actinomycetota bacterium]